MPQHDLYGDQLPTQYATDATRQPELFGPMGSSGSAWMRAAEAWAEVEGLTITRFQADWVFFVGRIRFGVTWTGDRWTVSPI